MIEIKMTVHDAIELSMLAQLQQMLEQKRAQDHARQFVTVEKDADPRLPHTVVEPSPAAEQTTAIPEQYSALGEPAEPDEPVVQNDAPVPSDIEVARAITEYSQRAGVPKARELIESFGVKNAMAVPDERRAEFVQKTRTEGL